MANTARQLNGPRNPGVVCVQRPERDPSPVAAAPSKEPPGETSTAGANPRAAGGDRPRSGHGKHVPGVGRGLLQRLMLVWVLAELWFGSLPAIGQTKVNALPAGSVVAGLTLEEWSAEWWKWALAFPISKSPLYDTNRHAPFAHSRQPDPVFFIGGAITTGPGLHFVTREVTIRSDVHVFFPIINFTGENVGRAVSLSPQELRDEAVVLTSLVAEARASVDGVEIPGDRILRLLAPVFSYTIPDVPDNLFRFFGVDFSGIADPAVSDGYWVMLAPLPPGQHVVQFRGAAGPPHNVVHDITYHFTVRRPTLLEKLADLVNSVEGAGLSAEREQPLLTSLEAARASFDRTHLRAGIQQLSAFQRKVRAQLGRDNPSFAGELIRAAQSIVDRAKQELRGNRWEGDDDDDEDAD